MEPEIENAHRVGPRNEDKPRVIICKFLYRPQRYKVIQKKRDLEDGIWVTEDLVIWEDREAKKKLKEVMKEAFENGKKPRFARRKLYIDGALYRKTYGQVRICRHCYLILTLVIFENLSQFCECK